MVILIYFYKSTPKYTNYMCLCEYPCVIHIIILIIRFLKELLIFLIFVVEKDFSIAIKGVFWSFLGFRGILVICKFQGYFGHFWVSGVVFWSFLDLRIFWLFLKILEYFGHFHFSGILVILIIG